MFRFLNSFIVRVLLLVTVLFLQMHLWFSDSGFRLYQKIYKKIAVVESVNRRSEDDNLKISSAVEDLRQDGRLLSNNAREHLGMIGPDETLFQVASG